MSGRDSFFLFQRILDSRNLNSSIRITRQLTLSEREEMKPPPSLSPERYGGIRLNGEKDKLTAQSGSMSNSIYSAVLQSSDYEVVDEGSS